MGNNKFELPDDLPGRVTDLSDGFPAHEHVVVRALDNGEYEVSVPWSSVTARGVSEADARERFALEYMTALKASLAERDAVTEFMRQHRA